ncbi:hypothetical protein CVT26_014383, partial [Gymnopilus dilepis]
LQWNTTDLINHFDLLSKQKPSRLPSFEELEKDPGIISQHHATTQAYLRACFPRELEGRQLNVLVGSPWVNEAADGTMEDASRDNDLPMPLSSDDGDLTLANPTLFMRIAIWWQGVSVANADDDSGRLFKILKARLSAFCYSLSKTAYSSGFSTPQEVEIQITPTSYSRCTAASNGKVQLSFEMSSYPTGCYFVLGSQGISSRWTSCKNILEFNTFQRSPDAPRLVRSSCMTGRRRNE